MKYLFAAEADKIQNTLFRAARQRQVVGGSRLMAEFGEEMAQLAVEYGAEKEDILITAGGSFTILFPSKEKAHDFGRDLADTYRLLLDASITLAKPKPVNDHNFALVNEGIRQDIQRLKRAKRGEVDMPHAPTTAFCQSSGVGLAEDFVSPLPNENTQYLSAFARRMTEAGRLKNKPQKQASQVTASQDEEVENEQEDRSFLGRIASELPPEYEQLKMWRWAKNVDEIMGLDGEKRNVAYLVADANNMGMLFRQCKTADQLKELSAALAQATRKAVAAIIPYLVDRFTEANVFGKKAFLPILPLILAGDDAFVLLPANYALDSAKRFCLAFEDAMSDSQIVQTLRQTNSDVSLPTMSATIIICKGHYPYHLAHGRGEQLLKQTKRMVKHVGLTSNDWHSALAFEMLIGSELASDNKYQGRYQPTLSPYWVIKDDSKLSKEAKQASCSLDKLFLHRWLLQALPKRRLAEVRELFAPETLPKNPKELRQRWNRQLRELRDRIAVTSPGSQPLLALDQALMDLGATLSKQEATENPGYWFNVRGAEYYGHGLPDLLAVWPYAQSFDWALSDYEEGEE